MLTTFILHNQNAKSIPNCDVLFTNGELHQACGHVMLLMNTWPKYEMTKIRNKHSRETLQDTKKSASPFL